MTLLGFRNRQHTRRIDLRLLRKITIFCLKEIFEEPEFELGIHFVGAKKMADVNETFLQHKGSTDVITFDYAETQNVLHGEIFISIDDAVSHAKKFRTSWQSELVRYIVHGILHLQGHDDLQTVSRRKMIQIENQTVKRLSKEFSLRKLERPL